MSNYLHLNAGNASGSGQHGFEQTDEEAWHQAVRVLVLLGGGLQAVGHSRVKSAARMNGAVVIFFDSILKVNMVVESGVMMYDMFVSVMPQATLDNKLDWWIHVETVCKTGQSRLYFLRSLRSFNICQTPLHTVYHSEVVSALSV